MEQLETNRRVASVGWRERRAMASGGSLHDGFGRLPLGFAFLPFLIGRLGKDDLDGLSVQLLPVHLVQRLRGGTAVTTQAKHPLAKARTPYLHGSIPLLKVNEGVVFELLHALQCPKLAEGRLQELLRHAVGQIPHK